MKETQNNIIAYQMIGMSSILSDLANYGEREVYLSDNENISIIKDVLNSFDIVYTIEPKEDNLVVINMENSLWGN